MTGEEQGRSPAPRPAPSGRAILAPEPSRVVIKAVNWLGDLVMSLPAMRAVRRAFASAHLAVLVRKELAGFFEGADWLDEVLPYSPGSGLAGFGARRRIIAELRLRGYDLAVVMPNSFESAFWVAAAGITRRAGYIADLRGPMLTHKAAPPADALDGHQVHYWLAMVRETLGIQGDPNDFAIRPAPARVERMAAWLAERRKRPGAPLVALAPAAAYGPAKEWPAGRFAALVDLLESEFGAEAVLVGAPSERARCEQVAGMSRAGAIVAAGETDVAELVAVLSLARAFAGNDSGAMHIAGALGTPTVAIFGSTNPNRTGPLGPRTRVIWHRLECSPCLARTCRFGHYNCLVQVQPDEVIESLRALGAFA
jgi:heptosyltransferase-2